MKASAELNRLIHENVMGLCAHRETERVQETEEVTMSTRDGKTARAVAIDIFQRCTICGQRPPVQSVPDYFADFSAAWQVRDKLRSEGIYLDIRATADFDEVTAINHDGQVLGCRAHPSTARAIAMVACDAKGVEVPQ